MGSIREDVGQKSSSKSDRKVLQERSETSNVVWFGAGGTDRKTELEVAELKDVEILFGIDEDGQD